MELTSLIILTIVLAMIFVIFGYMYVQNQEMAKQGRFKMSPGQKKKDQKKSKGMQ